MADPHPNRIREYRQQCGWSQSELAHRAGVSRAAVSAIEMGRLVPSVASALALAAAFQCSVEDLFGPVPSVKVDPEWAWQPPSFPARFWLAEVNGQIWRFPVEPTATSVLAHDGIMLSDGTVCSQQGASDPRTTLVLACCDPAASLLVTEYSRQTGWRVIALPRPSGQALTLLQQGRVHAAGIHFATKESPRENERVVGQALGPGWNLLRVARWHEGLTIAAGKRITRIDELRRRPWRWIGREPGSAARRCLDECLEGRVNIRRIARDHRGVAQAVRDGWADVGVCHRLVSDEAGLQFIGLRWEIFDWCFAADLAADRRIVRLIDTVRSPSYRHILGELPGYDSREAGELYRVKDVQ